jgi:cytochrome c
VHRLSLAVTLTLLAGAACAQPPPGNPSAQPSLERGRILIQRNCAGCHAVGRSDTGPLSAAPPLRDLEQRYPVEMLEEALAEGILTGHPAMPEFRFTPAEIGDVTLYLKSIQTRRSAASAQLRLDVWKRRPHSPA